MAPRLVSSRRALSVWNARSTLPQLDEALLACLERLATATALHEATTTNTAYSVMLPPHYAPEAYADLHRTFTAAWSRTRFALAQTAGGVPPRPVFIGAVGLQAHLEVSALTEADGAAVWTAFGLPAAESGPSRAISVGRLPSVEARHITSLHTSMPNYAPEGFSDVSLSTRPPLRPLANAIAAAAAAAGGPSSSRVVSAASPPSDPVGRLLVMGDKAVVDNVCDAVSAHHPGYVVSGLVAEPTPFVTGHQTTLYSSAVAQPIHIGSVGLVAHTTRPDAIRPDTYYAPSLVPIGEPMAITACQGNIITEIASSNATQQLLARLPPDVMYGETAQLYVKLDDQMVYALNGGDVSKGTLAIDTERLLTAGMTIQILMRPHDPDDHTARSPAPSQRGLILQCVTEESLMDELSTPVRTKVEGPYASVTWKSSKGFIYTKRDATSSAAAPPEADAPQRSQAPRNGSAASGILTSTVTGSSLHTGC
ncbi:hypothetical protein CXG81DRAFT_24302 [Caulochytrium protostelioides]|uniref:FIST domain-containing protein n=1 Tax=Caulochytrium protostelioides TaxID=1555241 RepID=A0A4P9XCC3_9FUNG|nr:hypothetical protein CXG81DRAFT_24302 [Caulochytrium protostelioides]|eukprot:RKP03097.1 hypothetical protein CXG81DRAFT_24302 [Caulochytrium protostelioides]